MGPTATVDPVLQSTEAGAAEALMVLTFFSVLAAASPKNMFLNSAEVKSANLLALMEKVLSDLFMWLLIFSILAA